MKSSRVHTVVLSSSKWTTARAITWLVQCAVLSSVGFVWKKSLICITSGNFILWTLLLTCQNNVRSRSCFHVCATVFTLYLQQTSEYTKKQGEPHDTAVNFNTCRILQWHSVVFLPQHGFLVYISNCSNAESTHSTLIFLLRRVRVCGI